MTDRAPYRSAPDTAMAAELFETDVPVVRHRARTGVIPAYRIPGSRSFRFFRDEVLDWLRSHPVEASAEAEAEEDARP